jgi:Uncharacterized conserved protein (DUF2285)
MCIPLIGEDVVGHIHRVVVAERFGPVSSRAASVPSYCGTFMSKPAPDPPVADVAPDAEVLTRYDEQHLVTYLRLLDADAEGADWTEVASVVLHIDPSREPERARRAWETHLARARWMTEHGYQHLLRGKDS